MKAQIVLRLAAVVAACLLAGVAGTAAVADEALPVPPAVPKLVPPPGGAGLGPPPGLAGQGPAARKTGCAGAGEAALGLTAGDRRAVQSGLAALGYRPGPADGVFGLMTRAALKAWQAKTGRPATGCLTRASADTLKAAGRKAAAGRSGGRASGPASAQAPGAAFRDCAECPEMVVMPPGSFLMGSPASERGRWKDEGPQRRVRIGHRLAVGRYEVTRGEFASFVAATGHPAGGSCWTWVGGKWKERSGFNWRNPGFGQDSRHPVVCVNWSDARAYVGWLSRRTGQRYRLLSEAEWEYAARAGTRTRYSWGDSIGSGRANYGSSKTVPVGSYRPNRFGLYDMHGNVWEWVEDCWNGSYRGAPSDGSAWTSGDCSKRVLRGGSWSYVPGYLRSANRGWLETGIRSNSGGFRVARTLAP